MSTEPLPNNIPPSWRDSLPDDIKGNATLSTIQDVPALAKSYVELRAMTGRKAYDLPQADWNADKWKEWNKTIGVPEAADKYSPADKAMLDKAKVPPEVVTAAMGKFHEMGLTDRQAVGLLNWYLGDAAKGLEIQEQTAVAERTAGEAALRKEWGDKYEAKSGLLKAWLGKNADPEFLKVVDEKGLGNNPAFIKAIVKSAEQTLEDNSRLGVQSPFGTSGDAASALAEINDMKNRRLADPGYAAKFEDPKSEERKRWEELHIKAYNTKAA